MKFLIQAYDSDDNEIKKHSFTWSGLRFRATAWYRNLPWKYTSEDVSYFLIKLGGKTVERVNHRIPELTF